ncbi:uncharacterized protein LOC111780061 isoform X1 [Cucurbita pepo subsp. pepo]|uniref:uncharacterized protein LOC111780061 isoform X1 n=2 Tax=Cucurbita pepo subsp. pepo TaxID=3664 RepID=UPI000C9D5067|nr:uncharacterized protein LOC111780061 isoform X1 [Cucurbita pepo subsp. pepo]XP_023516093.1 uncharacterized protein LOC111780061 isoform X1 [Cucurbita pepo subsp. pepo]XP_023516094.1 uncharacterized protein LOC111780061 isoform X1 [Cucurbita pepo subsp. pepo]XP_023516095.1 uncharacterized protein LOC111780061 isoform X1 [Cucurbita pepo subsp. pepo]XP_023516096.1 uncharacterized protein LOC111780061 isoform X1 [Cucurbita pepo subsp. pepo]XP_023516097.1 uncharacterized protein LOC111780061 iso
MRSEFSDLVVNNMHKSRSMEKSEWKVDVESFKRRNYVVQERDDDPSESEAIGDRISRYSTKSSFKTSMDDELPELVVFLQETDLEFVKDICIDKVVMSHEKCIEENCDTENGLVPDMLKHNTPESDCESSEESEYLESSVSSTESTQILEEDLFNKVNEKQKDYSSEVSIMKSVPILFLDRKVTGKKEAASTNSIARSLTKILDENRHKGKAVARSKSNFELGSTWTAGCRHCHDCGSTSMAEDDTPENHQNEDGSSAAHHLRPSLSSSLGSASLKSNSSTNSSHSFSFPILETEWIGSPERMAKADPLQTLRTRKQQLWRRCFPCCNF